MNNTENQFAGSTFRPPALLRGSNAGGHGSSQKLTMGHAPYAANKVINYIRTGHYYFILIITDFLP